MEAWARAVPASKPGTGADPEARWGHRNVNRTIEEAEMFLGYYMPAATMINDEGGPPVPELVRRITVCSSAHDPAAALVPVLADMVPAGGVRPGDILAGSGFSYRQLTRAIRHAESRDLVGRNVATLVDTPKGQPGRPSKSLTLKQPAELLRASAQEHPPLELHAGLKDRRRPLELMQPTSC